MSNAYSKAGVNLEAGYDAVKRMKRHVEKTKRLGAMGSIGGFGGCFDLSSLNMKNPVLVSGTDGVGTKLLLAQKMDKHDTIGQDVVAMCVNDVLATGAEPLFFLDYIAIGKLDPVKVEQIVKGVSDGCVLANSVIVGGETAEMPDMYDDDEYDIAGFSVGAIEKERFIDGSKVEVGDVLIGIPSSGVHSNGFSLVRKIIFEMNNFDLKMPFHDSTLGEVLLTPTRIYTKEVLALRDNLDIHAFAHVTGGGFDEKVVRVIKEGQGLVLNEGSWPILPIFKFLEEKGQIDHREMYNVFNMGIGMVAIVAKEDAQKAVDILQSIDVESYIIGEVISGSGVKVNG